MISVFFGYTKPSNTNLTGDIKILKSHYGVEIFDVEDRTTTSVTTTLKPGEPVKRILNTSTHSAQPLLTGDAEEAVDIFLGIVKEESTETASVDGKVKVELVGPGSVVQGLATTTANIDTVAKFLLLQGDYICFDVTASSGTNGIFSIDEDEGRQRIIALDKPTLIVSPYFKGWTYGKTYVA